MLYILYIHISIYIYIYKLELTNLQHTVLYNTYTALRRYIEMKMDTLRYHKSMFFPALLKFVGTCLAVKRMIVFAGFPSKDLTPETPERTWNSRLRTLATRSVRKQAGNSVPGKSCSRPGRWERLRRKWRKTDGYLMVTWCFLFDKDLVTYPFLKSQQVSTRDLWNVCIPSFVSLQVGSHLE